MKIKYLGTAAYEGVPAMFCNCPVCKKAMKQGDVTCVPVLRR